MDFDKDKKKKSGLDDFLGEDFEQKSTPKPKGSSNKKRGNNETDKEQSAFQSIGHTLKTIQNKIETKPQKLDKAKDAKRTKSIRGNMTGMVVIFVLMFISLIAYTSYSMAMYGSKWFASPYNTRVTHQKDKIIPGSIYDINGLVMADADENGNRRYPQSEEAKKANAHIMGDQYGITSGGAEALYSKYIYGFNLNMVDRIVQAYKAQKQKGNDITLTVDSDLNKYIYQEMGKHNGAVVVMNYKTGAVLASVSKESFDISKAQELAKQEYKSGESFFLNKAANGKYPPGSTFKLITTASALENIPNALSKTYESSSEISIGGSKVTNFDRESHGTIDLKRALEVSSNTYFAQLSKELGKTSLNTTAESFGFNKDFLFDDVIMSASTYNPGKNDNNLAWSAVGQHEDLVTPMHMCMIVSAIANDGAMMEPKTLYSVKDSLGINIYNMRSKKIAQPISPQIASQMQSLMIGVVENGTGRNAAVNGLTIGGKTGSAETGNSTHAWFVGYIQSDETPYAVAIILENAGTGGKNAAPLAKKIFSKVANK